MKRLVFILTLISILFSACKESRNKAVTSLIESVLEKSTGLKVDALDVNNLEKNKATAAINIGKNSL